MNDRTECLALCIEQAKSHNENAKNATHWNTFLSTLNIILVSALNLGLIIMSVLNVDNITSTIISGAISFFIIIGSKAKDDFNFQALSILHFNACDDYNQLYRNLRLCDESEAYLYTNQFELIRSKNHHKQVCRCPFCCCFK